MDAHLVFDRAAGNAVAVARLAVGIELELRNDEQRNALHTIRRALNAGEHQMDDVIRHVVFAGRDEDLLAGDLVGAVAGGHCLGAQQAEIGAAMGLGEIHRAGPGAGNHLRQIGLLLLVGSMHQDRGDRALGEAGIHGQCHVGGRHVLADGGVQRVGQALAAEFLRNGEAEPAAFAVEVEGFLEALGYADRAVVAALAAFLVAGEIDREQGFLGKLGRFADDRFDHVRRSISKTG
ncbi:hypothetical protein D9M72_443750 [compost metagenome]